MVYKVIVLHVDKLEPHQTNYDNNYRSQINNRFCADVENNSSIYSNINYYACFVCLKNFPSEDVKQHGDMYAWYELDKLQAGAKPSQPASQCSNHLASTAKDLCDPSRIHS